MATRLAFVLLVAACSAGCNVRGGGGAGIRTDGASTDDAEGGGFGGSGGATISCNSSATGCLCLIGDSQPGQITTCSPTSVAQNEMERGVCCVAQALCTCIRYTCRSDPATSYCQCGSTVDLATVTLGTQVAECPPPTTDQKCCASPDNGSCICSRLACGAEEIQVANCSATAAGACMAGGEIPACR
jgi:hypothetical protein